VRVCARKTARMLPIKNVSIMIMYEIKLIQIRLIKCAIVYMYVVLLTQKYTLQGRGGNLIQRIDKTTFAIF
jgi:hypothetical protein